MMSGLQIPVYNKFKNFNYHDCLASFVLWEFTEQHRRDYLTRKQKIKDHKEAGEELTGFDIMTRDSKEFWEMTLLNQEYFLEVDDPDFQKVINRLEKKDKNIMKLKEMRKLRTR